MGAIAPLRPLSCTPTPSKDIKFSGNHDMPLFAPPDHTKSPEKEKTTRQTWRHYGEARSPARNCSSPSAIFRQLDEPPEIPTENAVSLEVESNCQLRITREKEIACNLAFLFATSEDILKVMAVCVEEHHNKKGITIRVAANTGDLSAVTAGLARFARVLEYAAQRVRSKSEDTEEAFREVVSLDLDRILSRLRSHHAKPTRRLLENDPSSNSCMMQFTID